ncbi:MAG: FtsX-like permease family protein [Candidatus Bathyarchaeia archaeon]
MFDGCETLGVLTRALRNVSRRKMRAFLVIVALGFSMAVMISIPAGIVANQEATQTITENLNATISNMEEEINKTATLIECSTSSGQGMSRGTSTGMPGGMPPFGSEQEVVFVNETVVDEIGTIEGVKDVVPFFETSSEETTSETISGPGGRTFTISRPVYTITGVCLNSFFINSYSILPTNITLGRNLSEGDSGVILASSNFADYFVVTVGDEVEVYGEYFTVIGIYESPSESRMETRTVYLNISDAQMITDNVGNASRVDVHVVDVSYVDEIAEVIEVTYSDLSVTTYKDRLENVKNMQEMYEENLNNAESTLAQTQTVAAEIIIVAVAATSLIVLFVMLYTVRERTKEIGTLKAIGFSNWNVMSQFMLEGILMSLMAGVVGIAIAGIGAPIITSFLLPTVSGSLFGGSQSGRPQGGFASTNLGTTGSATTVSLSPELVLLAFSVAVLLGALGSLYPAWRAARTRPAEAMRYE